MQIAFETTATRTTTGRTDVTISDALPMVGTPKQVAYAEDARVKLLAKAIDGLILKGLTHEQIDAGMVKFADSIATKTSAKLWIDAFETTYKGKTAMAVLGTIIQAA